jgi:hypothetical protein
MYLQLRYRTWMAFHDIPPTLRGMFGDRKRFAATLSTGDRPRRGEAARRHLGSQVARRDPAGAL